MLKEAEQLAAQAIRACRKDPSSNRRNTWCAWLLDQALSQRQQQSTVKLAIVCLGVASIQAGCWPTIRRHENAMIRCLLAGLEPCNALDAASPGTSV